MQSCSWIGAIPALITPMHDQGDVDAKNTERFFLKHEQSACQAVVLLGSTGEGCMLDQAEAKKVWSIGQSVFQKTDVIAGIAAASTRQALQKATLAEQLGAKALLVSPPYYIKPCIQAMEEYVHALIAETSLPIMLYDIAQRTGVSMPEDILNRFQDRPRVFAIKDASGSLQKAYVRLKNSSGPAFYSGDDATSWLTTLAGGHGCVSVIANLFPDRMHHMLLSAMQGDHVGTRSQLKTLEPWLQAIALAGNPSAVKYLAGKMFGFSHALRAPLRLPDASARASMDALCEACAEMSFT